MRTALTRQCAGSGAGSSEEDCGRSGRASRPTPGEGSRPVETPGSSMKICAVVPAAAGKGFSGVSFRIALCFVLAVLGLGSACLYGQSARSLYKRGEDAEARQDYDAALNYYQQARQKNPKELQYRASVYRIRVTAAGAHVTKGRKLLAAGNQQGALVEFLRASEEDPGNEAAQQQIALIRSRIQAQAPRQETSLPEMATTEEELDSMGPPPVLKPVTNEPLTLHMTEDSKVVYQAVGKAAGINVLFDPDYSSKRIQVDLSNVTLLEALRIVATMSNTFWRPVTSNTIFVAQNTRAKRTELEEQAVQTFYLTNAWQQNDLNDVQTALRNVLPSAKVYGVASQNAIVMRGTPDELLLAQKIVDDLDKARSEVVVDIAVLEVSKNWERTLGLEWPTSAGVAIVPPTTAANSTTTTNPTTGATTTTATPTLYNFAHLNSSDFQMTVGAATANLLLTDSATKILQNPRIRATDGQKASMKVGSRIPIATGSYQTGAATAMVSSLVNTQFQYLDVGVNIEITPTVHYDHDITLKVKIEVTSQSGSTTISGVTEPIIAQKTSEQTVRLQEGEANILGGILDQQDQTSWTGIPGLSSIPILKYLFGSKDHTITNDEIVFLMVPHIVRSQYLSPVNLRTIDTGVGQSIELRHVSVPLTGAGAPAAARPAAAPQPQVGTVPGQTAEAAGPAALEQLRAAADGNTRPERANPPPPAGPPGGMTVAMTPPAGAVAAGTTFDVPVTLSGGVDVTSVPVQIQYDASKLELVGVDTGDLLAKDGQAVTLVHRDDGPGLLTINVSRPPGSAGVSGSGVVYVLHFRAKAAGASSLTILRAGAVNKALKLMPAQGGQATVQVR